jgi:hypothetical protein
MFGDVIELGVCQDRRATRTGICETIFPEVCPMDSDSFRLDPEECGDFVG